MSKMNPRHVKQWEKIRNKGKLRYIINNGLLIWGIFIGIVVRIVINWFEGKPITLGDLIIRFFLFSILGVFYAISVWKKQEKRYLDVQETRE